MIHLRRREQGLLTPPGNPGHIRGPADLRGLRTAMRPFGAGTRMLPGQLLAQTGISPGTLSGPEASSHLEVTLSIASGQADAGLGIRAAATTLDLDLVPVTWESPGGYDLSRTGSVEFLS